MVLKESVKKAALQEAKARGESFTEEKVLFEYKARLFATLVQFVVTDGGCSRTSDVIQPFYFKKPKKPTTQDAEEGASGAAEDARVAARVAAREKARTLRSRIKTRQVEKAAREKAAREKAAAASGTADEGANGAAEEGATGAAEEGASSAAEEEPVAEESSVHLDVYKLGLFDREGATFTTPNGWKLQEFARDRYCTTNQEKFEYDWSTKSWGGYNPFKKVYNGLQKNKPKISAATKDRQLKCKHIALQSKLQEEGIESFCNKFIATQKSGILVDMSWDFFVDPSDQRSTCMRDIGTIMKKKLEKMFIGTRTSIGLIKKIKKQHSWNLDKYLKYYDYKVAGMTEKEFTTAFNK